MLQVQGFELRKRNISFEITDELDVDHEPFRFVLGALRVEVRILFVKLSVVDVGFFYDFNQALGDEVEPYVYIMA